MSTISKKIFVTSSFFLAFIDRVNLNHQRSVEIFEYLARQKYQVYTSSFVILQTFNSIEQDLGSAVARDFLQAILESNIHILYGGESDLLAVFRYLKANPGRQASISSAVNANLMQKNGINSILTFDFWPNTMGTSVSSLITT